MSLAQKRFAENVLVINSTGAEIEEGSVNVDNEHVMNTEKAAHSFAPDSDIIYSKRNFIDFTLFQPLFITVQSLTDIQMNWKEYKDCGATPTSGKYISLTKSCLVPQSFSADKISAAKFQTRAYSLFDGGNGMTAPAPGLASRVKMLDPYFLDSVTVGGVAVKSLKGVQCNFGHTVEWPDEFEPEEIWVSASAATGSINTDDLDQATIARLQSVETGAIVIGLKNKAGATTNVTFSNCSIMGSLSGSQFTINWKELTA